MPSQVPSGVFKPPVHFADHPPARRGSEPFAQGGAPIQESVHASKDRAQRDQHLRLRSAPGWVEPLWVNAGEVPPHEPRTHMTSVLIGKDHILGGWWSKIEVMTRFQEGLHDRSPCSAFRHPGQTTQEAPPHRKAPGTRLDQENGGRLGRELPGLGGKRRRAGGISVPTGVGVSELPGDP